LLFALLVFFPVAFFSPISFSAPTDFFFCDVEISSPSAIENAVYQLVT